MAAYVISEVEMLDETQGRRYRELAAGSIARHGGRYLVRGAAPSSLKATGRPTAASSSSTGTHRPRSRLAGYRRRPAQAASQEQPRQPAKSSPVSG
jgi:Domain of unknown function (DUF1330)